MYRHDDRLFLTQTKYIRDLLDRSKMSNTKPSASPAESGSQLTCHGDPSPDPKLYRSIVGALQYATITRPEIAYAVNRVCQYMHSPTDDHWKDVKRILRYLKGTLHYGLSLCMSADSLAYSDAGWATNPDDKRSQYGFAIFLGPNLISWSSRKQTVVARSSTEAEYRAAAFASAELIWLQQLL